MMWYLHSAAYLEMAIEEPPCPGQPPEFCDIALVMTHTERNAGIRAGEQGWEREQE